MVSLESTAFLFSFFSFEKKKAFLYFTQEVIKPLLRTKGGHEVGKQVLNTEYCASPCDAPKLWAQLNTSFCLQMFPG